MINNERGEIFPSGLKIIEQVVISMTTQGKVVIRCREEKNDSDVIIFQLKYIFQKDINNSKNIFHWKSQKNIKDLVCNIVWFAEQELHKDNS